MWEKLLESTTSPRTYTQKSYDIRFTTRTVLWYTRTILGFTYDMMYFAPTRTLWIWQIRIGLNFDLYIIAVGHRWHWSHFSSPWFTRTVIFLYSLKVTKRYVIKWRGDKIWPEKEPTNWNCIEASCNFATSLWEKWNGVQYHEQLSTCSNVIAVLWSIFVGILQSWVFDT